MNEKGLDEIVIKRERNGSLKEAFLRKRERE